MALMAAVQLAGCATPVFNQASNLPLSPATPENMGAPTDFVQRNAIFFSTVIFLPLILLVAGGLVWWGRR